MNCQPSNQSPFHFCGKCSLVLTSIIATMMLLDPTAISAEEQITSNISGEETSEIVNQSESNKETTSENETVNNQNISLYSAPDSIIDNSAVSSVDESEESKEEKIKHDDAVVSNQEKHSFDNSSLPEITDPSMEYNNNKELKDWHSVLSEQDINEIKNNNDLKYYTEDIESILNNDNTPTYLKALSQEFMDIAEKNVSFNNGEFNYINIWRNNTGIKDFAARPMETLYSKTISMDKHFVISEKEQEILNRIRLSAYKILEKGYQYNRGNNNLRDEYQDRLSYNYEVSVHVPGGATKKSPVDWNKYSELDKKNILAIEKITGHSPHVEKVKVIDANNQRYKGNVQVLKDSIAYLKDNDINNYSFYSFDRYYYPTEANKTMHFAVHNSTLDIYRIMGNYFKSPELQLPYYDIKNMPIERSKNLIDIPNPLQKDPLEGYDYYQRIRDHLKTYPSKKLEPYYQKLIIKNLEEMHSSGKDVTSYIHNIIKHYGDTDGDGLWDLWEMYGYDHNNDGKIDENDVNLLEMGANPYQEDVFIQVNWENDPDNADKNAPNLKALKIVTDQFWNNKIRLHIDAGPKSVMSYDFVDKDGKVLSVQAKRWEELSKANDSIEYEESNFGLYDKAMYTLPKNPERVPIFINVGYVNGLIDYTNISDGEISGFSWSQKNVNFFAINTKILRSATRSKTYRDAIDTFLKNNNKYQLLSQEQPELLGIENENNKKKIKAKILSYLVNEAVIRAEAGTFMHELGHSLGLTHGGTPNDNTKFKPNHLSIMNYLYQFTGLLAKDHTYEVPFISYQDFKIPEFNIKLTNEKEGLRISDEDLNELKFLQIFWKLNNKKDANQPSNFVSKNLVNISKSDDQTAVKYPQSIDFDGNGEIDEELISVDFYLEGNTVFNPDILAKTEKEWDLLKFGHGSIGALGRGELLNSEQPIEPDSNHEHDEATLSNYISALTNPHYINFLINNAIDEMYYYDEESGHYFLSKKDAEEFNKVTKRNNSNTPKDDPNSGINHDSNFTNDNKKQSHDEHTVSNQNRTSKVNHNSDLSVDPKEDSSNKLEEIDFSESLNKSSVASLPSTGEKRYSEIFIPAVMSILIGLGLIVKPKEE